MQIVEDDWEAESVFGLLSALAPGSTRAAPQALAELVAVPELILCTDMGTEVADFVITTGQRVAFIHAKATWERHLYSASALHDVAAQAIKNLPHLQPLTEAPMNITRWTRTWSAEGVDGSTYRLRYGTFAQVQLCAATSESESPLHTLIAKSGSCSETRCPKVNSNVKHAKGHPQPKRSRCTHCCRRSGAQCRS